MTKPNVGVDSPETINRFIAQMRGGSNNSSRAAIIPRQESPKLVPEQRDDLVFADEDVSIRATVHRTEPIDIPITRANHSTTPNCNSPASPVHHATTSPHFSGLRPPQNTPKTNPATPRVSPGRNYDDELADVSHVVSTIVDTLDTKSLSQSIWAPKSGEYHRSSLGAFSTPSRDLTPVRVVEPNPAINDSFTRMSFKAADSDHEIGRPLIGEHLYKSPPSKSASKQSSSIPPGSQKLEAETVPIADRNIIKASHSAANGSPTLRPDANKVRFQESPSVKPLTFSNLIQKESAVSSNARNNSSPRHNRTPSCSSQATIGSTTPLSDGLDTNAPSIVSVAQLTSDGAQEWSTSIHTDQVTIPFNQQVHETTTGTEIHLPGSKTSAPEKRIVAALRKLGSTRSLNPEETALLADLETLILGQTTEMDRSDASKLVGKTGDVDAPHKFLDRPASKAKNTKENTSLPATAIKDPLNHTAKPAAGPAAVGESSKALSQPVKASPRPPLAAKATNSAPKSGQDIENREHKTFFNAWPQLEQRDRPAAQVRTVIIKDLPRSANPSFVASLVYGGPIEWISMRSETAATVRFMDAKDCQKYYDDTSNGVVYGKDAQGRELVCFIELGKDVDVIGGLLRGWIDTGVTRCVKAVGVDEEYGLEALRKIGERKDRKVESTEDGKTPGGIRSVVWHFCKIDEAVQFKAALHRDEEWEHCNIHYATDPCATATGVHLNK